ncbi:MAG: iron-sulfur cluster assembly protein [Candidatus Neomarinimicrobiota bacterium]
MGLITKEQVIDVLKQCYDPEIPIDLWNLGLIYDIQIKDNFEGHSSDLNIVMSLTTPGCGMGRKMAADITRKLKKQEGVKRANVEITFDPPWNPSMVSPAAQKKLKQKILPGMSGRSCFSKPEENWE